MITQLIAGRCDVWRGSESPAGALAGEPTDYPALDALLPGGGWPRGALTELLVDGGGALELVLPAMARLSGEARWIALVDPPFPPFAPGFAGGGVRLERLLWIRPPKEAERLWALEQALRGGACSIVLGWVDAGLAQSSLRRLQLAAEAGNAIGFLFSPPTVAARTSSAALRLRVWRREARLMVEILKRRGGWAVPPLQVSRDPLSIGLEESAESPRRAEVGNGKAPADSAGQAG